jgi:hypothetical protein
MNILKRLFAGRTPTETENILGTMAAFTEAAYLTLPASDESDETLLAVSDPQTRQQTVFVFLFGALDALVHDLPFDANEKIGILQAYLQQTFQAMTQANREAVATFLIHASGDPDWTPIMQRGGQAMVDWGRGESRAPLMLSHIVSVGLEDADMMARDRSRNNANNA